MLSHSEALRVEFVDTDAGGRIHHTAALRWAERAEHQLLRSAGWPDLTSFPRRHVTAEFLAPLRFGDELRVEIRATNVGRTSITYGWRVLRGDEVCITGATTCVHVDVEERPAPVPDALRAALSGEAVPASTGSGPGPGSGSEQVRASAER